MKTVTKKEFQDTFVPRIQVNFTNIPQEGVVKEWFNFSYIRTENNICAWENNKPTNETK